MACLGGRRQYTFNYTMYQGITLEANYPLVISSKGKQDCSYDAKRDKYF